MQERLQLALAFCLLLFLTFSGIFISLEGGLIDASI